MELNISWCDFTNNHVKSVVHNISPCVTHLNFSGYRENLTLDGRLKILLLKLTYHYNTFKVIYLFAKSGAEMYRKPKSDPLQHCALISPTVVEVNKSYLCSDINELC